jgi:hypothetical protein
VRCIVWQFTDVSEVLAAFTVRALLEEQAFVKPDCMLLHIMTAIFLLTAVIT